MIHTFSAVGVSPTFRVPRDFNVDVVGAGTPTIVLERFVAGFWTTVQSLAKDDPFVGFEPDRSMPYRFNCTALSGGDVIARAK